MQTCKLQEFLQFQYMVFKNLNNNNILATKSQFVYLCSIFNNGLHNNVDIKISIIHKKRKIILFNLNSTAI